MINTEIFGPYMWDLSASFVLSANSAILDQDVFAGNIVLNLKTEAPNSIPYEQGYLIFDYGLETQEGPIRYMSKASESVLLLDPAFVFQHNHTAGSSVVAIRRKGAPVLSGLGTEYPFYLTDPAQSRVILQDLIRSVKSSGIFINYIIRYPQLYYSEFDVYSSTTDPLD
jgi:hypothetical protein